MKTLPYILTCAVAVIAGTGTPAFSQAPTPFSTAVRNYAYIGKAGFNASTSPNQLFTTTNPSSAGGGFGPGLTVTYTPGSASAQGLNGAGINGTDGYLYAIDYLYNGPSSANARFYRIGDNAVAEQIGVLLPPTTAEAGRAIQYSFVNSSSGLVDNSGDYWFTAFTLTDLAPPLSGGKLDFFLGKMPAISGLSAGNSSLVPEYYHLDISDSVLQQGYTNFITSAAALVLNGFPFTNVGGGWQDMGLNPTDRRFYSYLSFPSTAPPLNQPYPQPPLDGYLAYIDPLENDPDYWGKVVLVNQTPNTVPNQEEDGAWFDAAGDFYTLFTNGEYAQVNLSNGTLGSLIPSGLPLANGQTQGDLATNSPVVPLPVELLAFTGKTEKGKVTLQWEFGDWQLIKQVNVERSTDGRDFERMAQLEQKAPKNTYQCQASSAQNSYYRLQILEQNGTVSFSPVLNIYTKNLDGKASVYPNPASRYLHIQTQADYINVTITTLGGNVLFTGKQPGVTILSTADLPAGIYHLTATDEKTGRELISQLVQKQ